MGTAELGAGAGKRWRVLAWTNAVLYIVLGATLAIPGVVWMRVGLSATSKTRSPDESGAAMMFATLGAMTVFLVTALLGVGVASGFLARRLRRRPAGIPTIIFLSLTGLGPLVLLACMMFLR
jgi:hypothetical protein